MSTYSILGNPGVAQEERLPLALEDGYVLPFERSLAHELAALARLARSVKNRDINSTHWQTLFETEPAFVLAELLTLADAQLQSKSHNLDIESLVATRLERLQLSEAADIQALSTRVSEAAKFVQLRRLTHGANEVVNSSSAEALLQHRQLLEDQLGRRLKSQDIDPALGLLLAALFALRDFKARLNRFPDELLDYYYRQVLGLTPREGGPTAVSLVANANSLPVAIPDGTVLSANFSGNSSVPAKTVGPTRVVAASVQKLYQLRYWRDPSLSPVNVLSWVSNVAAEQLDKFGSKLFSANQTPPMGLLIESPIFALAGGKREIDIRLDMAHKQEIRPSGGHGEASVNDVIEALAHDPDILIAFSNIDVVQADENSGNVDMSPSAMLSRTFADWVYELNSIAAKSEDKGSLKDWNATDTVFAALLSHIDTKLQFRTVATRIVCHVLLSGARQWPADVFLGLLVDAARRAKMPDPVQIVGNYSPEDLLFILLGDAFIAEISSAAGTFEPTALYVTANPGETPGIKFTLHLDATAPAVEAMDGYQSPYVRLSLSPNARFSPISLFEDVRIDAIDLSITVKGLTKLFAFNDDGPLAVSQTMLPFGSQPKDGSEFLVGSPEIANKSIEKISLSYTLTDLPPLPDNGSLNAHYANYGEEFYPPEPLLDTSLLSADGWVPVSAGDPLICGAIKRSDTQRYKSIGGDIANTFAPPPVNISALDFVHRQSVRAGLVRLRLETSGRHFGTNTYPLALADAIRRNQIPLVKAKIPNPPLTIKFSHVSLDYRARRYIAIRTPAPVNTRDRVIQLGAFGNRQLYPATSTANTTLFPQKLGDGTLFIGIGPNVSIGPVSLLFDFDDGGHERLSVATNQVLWHVMTQHGWQKLNADSIYADTTEGLHRTGVVTLNLPTTTTTESTELQAGLCWIAASATDNLDTFPFLKNVYLNGMSVSVASTDQKDISSARWSFDPPIPGLGDIEHIGATRREGRPRESITDFRVRVAEGLHHRQRGVTAWDIERIVLDKYPQVWKCKCYPRCDGHTAQERAGSITLLVIPHRSISESRACEERMFDSITLDEIQRTVAGCMNAFTDITIRNPSFDRLQVRAEVYFEHGASAGSHTRELSGALSDRLSVWTADKPMNGPGWSLNIDELAAFAEKLPFVRAITNFEVLHLVHDCAEGRFLQLDTFKLNDSVSASHRTINHHGPWSLPLSMPQHLLKSLTDEPTQPMQPAGIGELSVGETLLVQQTPESTK